MCGPAPPSSCRGIRRQPGRDRGPLSQSHPVHDNPIRWQLWREHDAIELAVEPGGSGCQLDQSRVRTSTRVWPTSGWHHGPNQRHWFRQRRDGQFPSGIRRHPCRPFERPWVQPARFGHRRVQSSGDVRPSDLSPSGHAGRGVRSFLLCDGHHSWRYQRLLGSVHLHPCPTSGGRARRLGDGRFRHRI